MEHVIYVVGECPSCGTGPLGMRVCGNCRVLCVLCEECDALWLKPDVSEPPVFPSQPELPCPQCDHSLLADSAHWACFAEIEVVGWQAHICAVGRPCSKAD